jgi:RNA polymerase sigma-70 factor, ECF subfamily
VNQVAFARDAERAAVDALVQAVVRCRFTLTVTTFSDLLLERVRECEPGQSAVEYAKALCLDDLYLATACAQGDDDAWREFRFRHFTYISDFARRFLHDAAARDVADQIIADLWQRQRLKQYNGRSTLRTWLGAVVTHAAINAGKVVRRSTTLNLEAVEQSQHAAGATVVASEEDHATRREFAVLVQRALGDLDPEHKLLLLLYYEQGLTLDQMTTILSVSKATLSRRLERLRQDLRTVIEARAQQQLDASAAGLVTALDFSRLEVDLSAALGTVTVQKKGGGGV